MDIRDAVPLVGQNHQPVPAESGTKNAVRSSAIESKNQDLDRKKIETAVNDVNQFFQLAQRKLSFSVNDVTNDIVIEVKDAETGQVLRQIPPDYVINLAEKLSELATASDFSSGLLLSDKA